MALVERRREQFVSAAVSLFASKGFYRTTVQDIAQKSGISAGLIYQYARTKEDVLLLSLLSVLQSYKDEIPKALQGVADPILRLWGAIDAYVRVIDRHRAATVLAYRSTKSLPKNQQELVKAAELETNDLIKECLQKCMDAKLVSTPDIELSVYLFVIFAHSWALKHWRLNSFMNVDAFINNGFELLITGMLTPLGRRKYEALKASRNQVSG